MTIKRLNPSSGSAPSPTVADAPGRPEYMISPWPELLIDVRTIRKIEYREHKDIGCGITSAAGVEIDGEFYRDRTRAEFAALKGAVTEWHAWAARRPKPKTPEAPR